MLEIIIIPKLSKHVEEKDRSQFVDLHLDNDLEQQEIPIPNLHFLT